MVQNQNSFFNAIKGIGNAIKAGAAAGVGIIQANPVTAAVGVVVLVGVTIYLIQKSKEKKEKEDDLKYSNGKHAPHPGDEKVGEIVSYEAVKKSVTDTCASNDTGSKLRKRQITQNGSSTPKTNSSGTSKDEKCSLTASKEVGVQTSVSNQTILNNLDSEMCKKERNGKFLHKNIPDTDSEENNDIGNGNKNSNDLSPVHLSGNESNISSTKSTAAISDSSSFSLLSGDSDKRGCEKSPFNIHLQPCNHQCSCTASITEENSGTANDRKHSLTASCCSHCIHDSEVSKKSTDTISDCSSFSVLSGDSHKRGCKKNPFNLHSQSCNHQCSCTASTTEGNSGTSNDRKHSLTASCTNQCIHDSEALHFNTSMSLEQKVSEYLTNLPEICSALNNEMENLDENQNNVPPEESVEVISISSIGTVFSGDSDICKGCETKPVNTSMQPCGHRYMCSNCAPIVLNLLRRCKVCRTRIENFVLDEAPRIV